MVACASPAGSVASGRDKERSRDLCTWEVWAVDLAEMESEQVGSGQEGAIMHLPLFKILEATMRADVGKTASYPNILSTFSLSKKNPNMSLD